MKIIDKNSILLLLIIIFTSTTIPLSAVNASKNRIGLALSGGGARGIAHIGLLRRLEEEGIEPYMISGASMGGLIGGLYALGYDSYEIETFFESYDFNNLFSNTPKRSSIDNYLKKSNDRNIIELPITEDGIRLPNSFSSAQMITQRLSELIASSAYSNSDFNKLKYRLRIVGSDIQQAKKIIFKSGNLVDILTATISFPAIFKPVRYNNMQLLDGGLTNNMPTDILEDCNIIILSNTTNNIPQKDKDYDLIELLDRISLTMTSSDMLMNKNMANILIEPKFNNIAINEFSSIDTLIEAGYQAADKQITKIKALLSPNNRVSPPNKTCDINQQLLRHKNIIFSGNSKFSDSELHSIIDYSKNISSIKKKILSYYKKAGYVMCTVKYDNTQQPPKSLYKFIIDEGYINSIRITGNYNTSTSFLRNELTIQEGDLLTLKKAKSNLNILYGTKLFSRVSYTINEELKQIIYNLSEKPGKVVRFGANYQTDRGFKGLIEVANTNIHRKNAELNLGLTFGEKNNKIELSYYNAFLKKSSIFYEFRPYYSSNEISFYKNHEEIKSETYSQERTGLQLNTGFQFYKNYQAIFTYTNEYTDYYKCFSADNNLFHSNDYYKNSFKGSIFIDNRDNIKFAQKGLYLSLNIEKGYNLFESNSSYHKTWGDLGIYFSIFKTINLELKISAGTTESATPYSELFPLGGKNSIPGTHLNEYYVKHYLTTSIGTRALLYDNRFVKLYYSVFYYVNQNWTKPDLTFEFNRFLNSFYYSFIMKTPLGPFEIGHGLTAGNHTISDCYRFYMTFGYDL